jgi:hypothetical protein
MIWYSDFRGFQIINPDPRGADFGSSMVYLMVEKEYRAWRKKNKELQM